jgi:hypothetical protein
MYKVVYKVFDGIKVEKLHKESSSSPIIEITFVGRPGKSAGHAVG